MAECQRCGRDTDRRTLASDPLCAECAKWAEEHAQTRDADQRGLGEWEDRNG
ncbi:MAG TPA: hypothetical protein VFJ06_14085 [Halococcus sp.]|nr:hypothetical protein [Halococcus sp.]